MKKIIICLLLLVIFVIGCSQEVEIVSNKEEFCVDNNMTVDNEYKLQEGWVRCCGYPKPISNDFYTTTCRNYKIKIIGEGNFTGNTSFNINTSGETIKGDLNINDSDSMPRWFNQPISGDFNIGNLRMLPKLEVHCDVLIKDYQNKSKVLYDLTGIKGVWVMECARLSSKELEERNESLLDLNIQIIKNDICYGYCENK